MAVTRTAVADLGAWFFNNGSTNFGNGKGSRMYVGRTTLGTLTGANRFAIRVPRGTLFDGIPNLAAITAINLKLRVFGGGCDGIGGTVKYWIERATRDAAGTFTENALTDNCGVNTSGAASAAYPGPTRVTTNRVKYEGSPSNGDWMTIPLLAAGVGIGADWYSNPSWSELVLVAIAADGSNGYEEATTARRVPVYSDNAAAGSKPYIEVVFNDEQAPLDPTDLLPADGTLYPTTNGGQVVVSARNTHPEGKASTQYEVEWYPTSATDAVPGTRLFGAVVNDTTAHNAVRSYTFTGRTPRTAAKWRIRFGRNGLWGPYSLLRTVTPVYQPTAVNPAVEPAELEPDFSVSLVTTNDPNDYITAIEYIVYQDPAQGQTITKWASGKVDVAGAPTRALLTYGGTAAVFGTKYRYRLRLWNRDDVPTTPDASWPNGAGDLFWTPLEAIGPSIAPSDTSQKINTRTPTFTLTDPGGNTIDQYSFRWRSPTGTLLAETGLISQASALSANVVTPAGIWDWGQDPQIEAAIRVTGNADLGPYSAIKTVHINAKPGSPYPLSISHATAQIVQKPDGVWVVDAATPVFEAPFRDVDKDLGYTERSTRREIEVRTLADAHFASSPYVATGTPADTFTLPTLTAENTYKVRRRDDDTASVRSDFSEYLYVKRSAKPTLSSVTPAAAATVTDPTPAIAWTYASSGGKAQVAFQITASVDGDQIYDSGLVLGTASSHEIPAGILPNDEDVDWTLDVYDADGLHATQIARTFTTDFTAPAAITGLAVAQNDQTKGLDVSWDESLLSATEHEAYLIYARTGVGQFELVETITDKEQTTYSYLFAPHNAETTIRVTQSNGWAESTPAEITFEPVIAGAWWLRPEPIELVYLPGGDFQPGPRPTRREVMKPLGARYATVQTWNTTGHEWRARLFVPNESAALIDLLTADQEDARVGILKLDHGKSLYSVITSVDATPEKAGFFSVAIEGIEVGRDAGTF